MLDKFKDECGVFGIFGHPEAANMTYLGLYALQHRGQESAGIAASDGEHVRVSRAMGYVADAFDSDALAQLPGSHRRSATCAIRRPARASLSNAQPIPDRLRARADRASATTATSSTRASCATSSCARGRSSSRAATPRSCCISTRARRPATVEDAIVESVSQVQGAFSLVMLTRDRLIAVRDPHGFRPLALGRLGDATVVCSETCAMDLIGATYVRDVEPGEVLVISADGMRSIKPFPPAPLAHCIFEHVYFARPDSYVFGRSVNEVRTKLGRMLAREQPVDADVVVPVPDSGRLRRDGLRRGSRACRCGWASSAITTSAARSSSRSRRSGTSA